jgi:serine/threonine protein kinase
MATPTPVRGLRPGTVLGGRYRIDEAIGAGGMGTVYRAVQLGLGRDVAVKLVGNGRGVVDAEAVARFEREARLLARLAHPGIVTVHDFGADDGTLFLVLEYVRGESLEHRLRRGPLPWPEATDVGADIAAALAAAHAAGVLHRDLKPANVMLSSGTATPVKLIDFGLARLSTIVDGPAAEPAAAWTASSSAVLGTPGYIAPEYAWTGAVSPAMDHYALGLVLFEMLTARHPFAGLAVDDDRAAVARQRLAEAAPDAPAGLVALVLGLLQPDPARRVREPAAELARLRLVARPTAGPAVVVDDEPPRAPAVTPRTPTVPAGRAMPPALVARPAVDVPGGVVRLRIGGRDVDVRVPAFRIDRHPVTHADWALFVTHGGGPMPTTWTTRSPPPSLQGCPVTGVPFAAAQAFARFVGGRLPTEAEWTLAACGPDGHPYPWGDTWQTGLSHAAWQDPLALRRAGPIGVFSPQGDSAFGVSDLLDVWEWVVAPSQTRGAVVRGGPWRDRPVPPSLHNRSWEDEAAHDVGFRCVR